MSFEGVVNGYFYEVLKVANGYEDANAQYVEDNVVENCIDCETNQLYPFD